MTVRIRLLGGFDVDVDGDLVASTAWTRRHAAALVKLLALSDRRRLHREQVMEALWPGLPPQTAAPRLHKAAHYARRALEGRDRLGDVLPIRGDLVLLLPDADVEVDVERLLRCGRQALTTGEDADVAAALGRFAGELLPEDPYEPWTEAPRAAVRALHLELLRRAGRWEELAALDPADEEAHVALARSHTEQGRPRAALLQLERLEQALRHELGTTPGAAARELRLSLESTSRIGPHATSRGGPPEGRPAQPRRLFGRREDVDRLRAVLDEAASGRGTAVALTGPPGVGKTSLLDATIAAARARGFRIGRGSASAVEGPWPYAPVLEAFGDLCRAHPALLDGLDDGFRSELDRAMSGREMHWSGESTHQRLFVAAAELVRLAASDHGLLLVLDDLHEADQASLRLVHYLGRCAASEPVLVAVAHRPIGDQASREVMDSLIARNGRRIDVAPLSDDAVRRLVAAERPELSPSVADHVVQLSAGIPFTARELARAAATGGTGGLVPPLPESVLATFRRVAVLGLTFTTDELLALAEDGEEAAYAHLEAALSAGLVEPDDYAGHRFRHPLVRAALLDQLPASAQLSERRLVAERLAALGSPPSRVAHQFLAAGLPARAVPFVLRAVETAGALGAYRDALALIDGVLRHASAETLPRLLVRRGDLLVAMGDPRAVAAYRDALPVTTGTEHRLVRARLARAATAAGDVDTARSALSGLEPEGDAADGPLLVARGNIAFFSGDVDTALRIADQAREMIAYAEDNWHLTDLVTLRGMIAHQRGELFDRFPLEMRRTHGHQRLATTVFDAHLCVAEYLLYGPVPYADVIAQGEELRRTATAAGALRGVAFAGALIGEAALLMGDLDRAERELQEAEALHREVDAPAGESLCLQRLAEIALERGDPDGARRLLDRALPLARWSLVGKHLLQRLYGTLVRCAPDPASAVLAVDQAEAILGPDDECMFCDVMLAVPATIACADDGDLERARSYLERADRSAARWAGTAWRAGVVEARAHLAMATGEDEVRRRLLLEAADLFDRAGHVRPAERCRAAAVAPYVGGRLPEPRRGAERVDQRTN